MTKSSPHKSKSLLLNVTMFLIVLPVLLGLGKTLAPGLGIGRSAAGGTHFSFYVASLAVLLVVAAVLIVWKGWIKTALVIIVVVCVGLGFLAGGDSGPKRLFLEVGGRGSLTTAIGADVFCNGMHLGRTPFTISREEFEEKVKPWEKPPRQERLDINPDFGDEASQWAKYTWVPRDVFQPFDVRPYDRNQVSILSGAMANEALRSGRYWWRSENDGHTGLQRVAPSGFGASGHGNVLTIRVQSQTEFPALQPHVNLLLEALRLNDYQPTEEWLDYFLEHKDILFLQIEGKPHYQAALEAAVRRDFNLPETPTAEDCDRVLGAILDRVEERGAFQIPSFESIAIDLMGQAASQAVAYRFKEEMHVRRGGSGGHARSEKFEVRYRSIPAVRLMPLEYAAKHLRPPELFAPLVYEYARRGRYFEIIASYGTDASSRILGNALRMDWRARRSRHETTQLLGQLVDVSSTKPEDYQRMLWYIQENATGTSERHHCKRFIEDRIGNPDVNQEELVTWVYHHSPFDEREKKDLIARIPSSQTYHYMRMFQVHIDKNKREDLIGVLARDPNPSLDQFVIDSYEWYRSKNGPGYWHTSVTEALVKTDTPAIRTFVTERLGKGDSESRFLLREMASAKAELFGLDWLVPVFDRMENSGMRQSAARVLQRINSSDAVALLERWADDSDTNVADAANAALAEVEKEREQAEGRQKQYADLLAGRITPDDLLPPAQPWVWNGSEYVPEAN